MSERKKKRGTVMVGMECFFSGKFFVGIFLSVISGIQILQHS